MNPEQPLGLPPGSVRAFIAIIFVGVWALLELGVNGSAAPNEVRAIVAGVAASYSLMKGVGAVVTSVRNGGR